MKRFGSLAVVASVVAACVVGLAGVTGASAAPTLPTLNLALTGKTGIKVSGAHRVGRGERRVDVQRQGQAAMGWFASDPGVVVVARALGAVPRPSWGVPRADPVRGDRGLTLVRRARCRRSLTPGNYVALNLTGNGPAKQVAQFTVTRSAGAGAVAEGGPADRDVD